MNEHHYVEKQMNQRMEMIRSLVKALTKRFTYRKQSSDFKMAVACSQRNDDGDYGAMAGR